MQSVNRLIAVDDSYPTFAYQRPKSASEDRIDREFAIEAHILSAGSAKLVLHHTPSRRDERKLDPEPRRVSADVEHLRLSATAVN